MRHRKVYAILFLAISIFAFSYDYEFKDLGSAQKVATIEKKMTIAMFSAQSCYYCKLFDKDTLSDKAVQDFMRANYVFVRLEESNYKTTFMGKTYTNSQLFSLFGIRGTPTFIFLLGNSLVTQVPGYMPPTDFLKALKYLIRVTEENYKESFDNYVKKADTLTGKPKLLNVSKADADYIIKYDKNSEQIDKVPEKIDINKVYVTYSEEVAKKLNEAGVIRVLLVK
ncbi:MAG TPA: thioredoxin fold domain-containing protein [Fervidobacterium sp.]|nr:thioredoxin fold domain-containing protein [Fervidobacterium sp.]